MYTTRSLFRAALIQELTKKPADRLIEVPEEKIVLFAWDDPPPLEVLVDDCDVTVAGKKYRINFARMERTLARVKKVAVERVRGEKDEKETGD